MSDALQVALFLACLAVVLFVAMLIPLCFHLYRCTRGLTRQLEDLSADLKQLVKDSRAMVQSVNQLSTRANQQLDELDKTIRVVQGWSERANNVVEEVTGVFGSPLLKIVQVIKTLSQTWKILSSAFADVAPRTDQKADEPADKTMPQESPPASSPIAPGL